MAILTEVWIPIEKLKILFETAEKKQVKGLAFNVTINDKPDQYDQNVSMYVKQTKEQQEAKAARYYAGNGKVVWKNDEHISVIGKSNTATTTAAPAGNDEDLPF